MPVEPLAHQASLVEHVVSTAGLKKILLADEVGLGKTIEAGLIIQRLQQASTTLLKVLYLTEARLVENVVEEFERLGISLAVGQHISRRPGWARVTLTRWSSLLRIGLSTTRIPSVSPDLGT